MAVSIVVNHGVKGRFDVEFTEIDVLKHINLSQLGFCCFQHFYELTV